jgi:outer membrane protein insertion porin family
MQDAIIVFFTSLIVMGGAWTYVASKPASAKPEAGQPGVTKSEATQPADHKAESGAAATQPPAGGKAAGAAKTPAAGAEFGRGEIIKSIEFLGNHKYKDHVLRERLGFELGDRLDPFLAEGGRTTISEVYRKIGFPFVKVSLDKERMADGHLLYTIDEGPRVQITSIEFTGNESFGSGTLRQVIKTKKRKWLLWASYYTEDRTGEDLDKLRDFYYNHGFLDYHIAVEKEFTADGSGVQLLFTIDEGPVYHVGEIRFSGNTRYTMEELRQKIELREGQVYLKPAAQRDAKTISQLYREQGYVDAEVRQTPKFTTREGDTLVTVEFEMTEGRQFRIGRIEVTGNEQTQDKVVRRVLDEYHFTPGELYNAKMAPKEGGGLMEKYVQRSAAAREVMIRPVNPPTPDPNRKDVRVNVEEGMTGVIIPGVGISTDNGVVGRLVFRQQNFDITDFPESLDEFLSMKSFRGAGQILSLTLEPGTVYSQYGIDFVDPYWRDRPIEFDVGGRSWKRYRESYDESRLKGTFGFEQRLDNYWRRSIGFRAENVEVKSVDYDAPQEIKDWAGATQLYGVRFGLGQSAVDDQYNPSTGHRVNGGYEQVTGDATFGLLEGTYVHYFPLYTDVLDRKTVLSAKVLAGTTVGDAPPFEKYYVGGSGHYGLRGFEYRGISPRGLQTNVFNPRRKDPIGSDWIFLAGAEVVFPLVGENFGGLLFVDSGTVETGRYRLSIGTGIQILIPQIFGQIPMRFEIAFPLLKDKDDETQFFSFSQPGMF